VIAPTAARPWVPAALEAVGVAAAGGVLAGASWSLVGLGWPAAVVGAGNGAISGGRGIYLWRVPIGPLAFALDSTWGLPMTSAAIVAHGVAATQRRRAGYVRPLSERANRHVYARGLRLRRGFAMTLGNVVNGAGDDVLASPRREQLVTDHEDVHIWQARWLGPLYPVLYVGWTILGGAAGALVWLVRRRGDRLSAVVETCGYYLNPLEWWAYSRDDRWPPSRKVAGLGWRRAVVRPFSQLPERSARRRARAGTPATPR
jgi:hypothetical protein